jgi:hypothetical protein
MRSKQTAKKKKAVAVVELTLRLDALEFAALRKALDTPRKPTQRQMEAHFNEVLEKELEAIVEEHGEEDDPGDEYA